MDDPVYELTQGGLREVKRGAPVSTAKPERRYLLGSPLLSGSLFLALLAYYIDGGEWMRSVERRIDGRQRGAASGPYRVWAENHPLSYEDVAATATALTGKAVLWEVARAPEGSFLFGGDGSRPLLLSGAEAELERIPAEAPGVRALARVEGTQNGLPALALLGLE